MNSVLKKHMGYEGDIGRDRLSELPDEVLVRILSFLPTLDAVRTVLLRRFRKLWTLVHTLDFSDSQFRPTFDENEMLSERHSALVWWFLHFVRYVLMLHRRPTIEKFLLTTTNETNTEAVTTIAEVEMWIRFALSREAKVLVCQFYDGFLPLSRSLYRSQSLVTLELESCKIVNLTQVHMGSLRTLKLSYVWMDYDSYNNLVSGCPSLQELVVQNPRDLGDLSLSSPSIKNLVFCRDDVCLRLTVKFDCPNLRILDITMDFDDVEVVDLSSIHELIINTSNCDAHKFRKLLDGCQSAQVLTLT